MKLKRSDTDSNEIKLNKVYRFRLYPTRSQKKKVDRAIYLSKWVYNKTLRYYKDDYIYAVKNLDNIRTTYPQYYDQFKSFTSIPKHFYRFGYPVKAASKGESSTYQYLKKLREERPELQDYSVLIFQEAQFRVQNAWDNYFNGLKKHLYVGKPRFKKYYDSITYTSGFSIENDMITFSKLGKIRFKKHRDIDGIPKSINIIKTPVDEYYANITVEYIDENAYKNKHLTKIVGIDIGFKGNNFLTLSDGVVFEYKKYLKEYSNRLKIYNKKMSYNEKDNFKFEKYKRISNRLHDNLKEKRRKFHEETCNKLFEKYDILVFEDINFKEMLESTKSDVNLTNKSSARINRNQSDHSPGEFIRMCESKAKEIGKLVLRIDPTNTTKSCSNCGEIVEKSIDERIHNCPHCGIEIDRDLNASINILNRGIAILNKTK